MRRWLLIAISLVVIGYLLTGVTQVGLDERAVVRRFGRVLDEQPGPGLHIGLPWGMDRVDRVAVDRVRRVEVGYRPDADDPGQATPPGQLLTGDQNLVNLQVVVSYAVRPERLADFVAHAEQADGLVARTTEAAMAEWVGSRTVDDVLLRGKVELPRWLTEEAQRRLEGYGIGVEVREATVAHLLPPAEVKSDFDRVNQAQTEIRTRLHQAEEQADRSVRAALAEKYRLEQLAAAYANDRRTMARAEADRFERRRRQYEAMRQANPAALSAIWWDEMSRLFARLREGGQVDLLDNHLGADGLDITIVTPKKK
jgi:membrane protease subunit HflK